MPVNQTAYICYCSAKLTRCNCSAKMSPYEQIKSIQNERFPENETNHRSELKSELSFISHDFSRHYNVVYNLFR